MKTFKVFLCSAMAVLFASACQQQTPEVTPEFPQGIGDKEVTTGEVVKLDIKANLDWELELKAEGGSVWFWFEEGSQHVSKIQGKATDGQEVNVHVSDQINYEDLTCEVIMTMKNESKTLATLVLPGAEKTITVRAASTNGENLVEAGEESDFIYDYSGEPVANESTITLVWPQEKNFYQMWFQVSANFEWTIGDLPKWLEAYGLTDDRIGTREFRFEANLEKISLDEQEGEIIFKDGENEMLKFKVVLPATKDIVRSGFPETINISKEGKILSEMGGEQELLTGRIMAAKGLQIYLPYFNGEWWYSFPGSTDWDPYNWVKWNETAGWDEKDLSKLQETAYSLSARANDGEERTAYILAIPASAIPEKFNADEDLFTGEYGTGDIKPEFKKYIVSTIIQEGTASGDVEFFTENMHEGDVTFGKMSDTDELYNSLVEMTPNLYTLVFGKEGGYIALKPAKKWSNKEVYSMTFEPYPANSKFVEIYNNQSTEFGLIPDKCGNERLECMVAFQDTENIVAIVHVIYDPDGTASVGSGPFSFMMPDMVKGATLAPYKGASMAYIKSETGVWDESCIWELKYTGQDYSNVTITYSGTPQQYPFFDWDQNTWLSYELMGGNMMWIDMKASESCYDCYIFQEEWTNKYVLVCTYEPAN